MLSDEHNDEAERPEPSSTPCFCTHGWGQHMFLLVASGVAVLAFALWVRVTGASPDTTRSQTVLARAPTEKDANGPSPTAVRATAALVEGSGRGTPPIGVAARTSLNDAADKIRPATLAVRASYGTDANGQPLERVGSAVIVDPAGYAVTCTHVVAGASAISVRRFRERERWAAARMVASDGDLSLLRIDDDRPFPVAVLSDSSKVRVGDWVLAVGHPFKLGLTVTAGIVSRRDATLTFPGGNTLTGLLQTDAAINEGSSGGPLANMEGELVGINAAVYAPTGVFSGAGFAITANRVRDFVSSILIAGQPTSAPTGGLRFNRPRTG